MSQDNSCTDNLLRIAQAQVALKTTNTQRKQQFQAVVRPRRRIGPGAAANFCLLATAVTAPRQLDNNITHRTMKRHSGCHSRKRVSEMSALVRLSSLALLVAVATLYLASSLAAADYAQPQTQQQPQQDSYGDRYDQQQQQQQQLSPSKTKKIQIVYIKVPLAKLKPTLANDYASGSSADNSTRGGQYEATAEQQTKSDGSQADQQQQQQLMSAEQAAEQQQQPKQHQKLSRHSSFLIPMAVVQTSAEPAESQQQPQQQSSLMSLPDSTASSSASSPSVSSSEMSQSQSQPAQPSQSIGGAYNPNDNSGLSSSALAQMTMMQNYSPFQGDDLMAFAAPFNAAANLAFGREVGGGRRLRNLNHLRPPMMSFAMRPQQHHHPYHHHLPQHVMMYSPSVHHGINHGFMSGFLMGEKDKMTTAALRIHQQRSQPPPLASPLAAASPAGSSPQTAAAATVPAQISASASSSQQFQNGQSQSAPLTSQSNSNLNLNSNEKPQGPGGLMPLMMMPFSHMPDNMIGQAYNAAVGQALPLESGAPSSLLSSPSNLDSGSKRLPAAAGSSSYNGGSSGINSDSGYSHGTASSGSYGTSGRGQQESTSSGSGYQNSGSGFVGSGPSSGYGSGISTYGASAAFSDYPTVPLAGLGQQTFVQSPSSNSNSYSQANNNNYTTNHQYNHSSANSGAEHNKQQAPVDALTSQKLRQAKKTIIPIVVQVEHAVLENNHNNNNNGYGNNNQKPAGGNKYSGARGHRQLGGAGGKRGARNPYKQQFQQQQQQDSYRNNNLLYGAASNEIPLDLSAGATAQFINAANAQDINQITAAINAENAASAAAALAQADAAFGSGSPAYIGQMPHSSAPGSARPNGAAFHHQGGRPGAGQYSGGLQSAASALLANTHPVIQAAASGGLASVTKLGVKLGEIMAMPSMQVPSSISSISSSFPSALSSITNQVGVQLNQAVQQVAKEHPTASAFARQVAQHAGISLPGFGPQSNLNGPAGSMGQHLGNGLHHMSPQLGAAASDQHAQSMSPQAQLQNLKISLGHNLQTAAAQLMSAHQKATAAAAQSGSAGLLTSQLASLYPQGMNAALKQLSGVSPMASAALANLVPQQQQQQQLLPHSLEAHHAQASSLIPVEQEVGLMPGQQPFQLTQQQAAQFAAAAHGQAGASDLHSSAGLVTSESVTKPVKSSLKSKFLSFFQPPKFISNFLSWSDRADARNDQGIVGAAYSNDKSSDTSSEDATATEDKSSKSAEEDFVSSKEKTSAAATDDGTSAKASDESPKESSAASGSAPSEQTETHEETGEELTSKVETVEKTSSSSSAESAPKVVKETAAEASSQSVSNANATSATQNKS